MKPIKPRRARRARTKPGKAYDLTVRPPSASVVDDDDCVLCRMLRDQEVLESHTLPDGSVVELRELPVGSLHETAPVRN
jgi:hypothetical protein